MSQSPQILIVSGEASGDLHGAALVGALREQLPAARFAGMGGREMAAAGVEILVDIEGLAVMGLVEVLGRFFEIRRALGLVTARLRERRPDLVVCIDYPGFNLLVARRAKKLGIPVFYFISPKVWAWRSSRVEKIKRFVDRMAVILPFEEEFYRARGYRVDFVGNPLLDSVRASLPAPAFRRQHRIEPGRLLVGILPGSRAMEIRALLPVFLAACRQLADRLAAAGEKAPIFLLPKASTISRQELEEHGLAGCRLDVRVLESEQRYDLMAACDAALAASGTVTLELAIIGLPMVVAYRVSPITWWVGQRLVKLQHVSLVNLVAGREVVPELLQERANPEELCRTLAGLLEPAANQAMRGELREVARLLGEPGAARRAAGVAMELLKGRQR